MTLTAPSTPAADADGVAAHGVGAHRAGTHPDDARPEGHRSPFGWLTDRGRVWVLTGLVLHISGWALGYPELVLLGTVALVGVALALLLVWLGPDHVQVSRAVQPARLTAGESAVALLTVTNRRRRTVRGLVVTDAINDDTVEASLPPVTALAPSRVHYRIPTDRRGRLRMGPLAILRTDPLRLAARSRPFRQMDTLWVHPRTHPVTPFPTGVVVDVDAQLSENAPRGTITFSTLREYVIGDDLRLVHWRSTARTGKLMVREHVDTSQPRLAVVVDTRPEVWVGADGRPDPDSPLFEAALEGAASVLRAAVTAECAATLLVAGENPALVAEAPGVDDRLAPFLDRLAAAEVVASEAKRFGGTSRKAQSVDPVRLAEGLPSGGTLVIFTGAVDSQDLARVATLRSRFGSVVVGCFKDRSPRASKRFDVTILDAATGEQFARQWNRLVG